MQQEFDLAKLPKALLRFNRMIAFVALVAGGTALGFTYRRKETEREDGLTVA